MSNKKKTSTGNQHNLRAQQIIMGVIGLIVVLSMVMSLLIQQ